MVRVTIEFEFPGDMDAATAALETFRGITLPAHTAGNVADWFSHLGEGSRSFWEIAARHAQTNATWTFDDLAQTSGIDRDTLRSYHRNSYRAINDESAQNPLTSEWDANRGCNVYRMADAVRDEILGLV
ncbi:MAG: hypothetical protein WD063_08490 [Pirellulales bacterium]